MLINKKSEALPQEEIMIQRKQVVQILQTEMVQTLQLHINRSRCIVDYLGQDKFKIYFNSMILVKGLLVILIISVKQDKINN
jgi:hypothetical protein